MKNWWISLLILPASIHIYDGEPLRFLQLLIWLISLIIPAAIFTRLGFSWGIARVLSLPALSFLPYVLAQSFSIVLPSFLWWLFVLVAAFLFYKQRRQLDIPYIAQSEKVFLISFIIFLTINSFHPSLYWGEKPMDLSLLGYFLRLESGPIHDPWAYMSELKYYALGYFSWALPAKASGLGLEQAYAYSLAAIAGLMAQAAHVFFYWLKREHAVKLALLLPLLGTLGVVNSFAKHSLSEMSFFWSASRVFDFGHFSEFPLWSFLFADLHPHVMAYPLVCVVICGIIKATLSKPTSPDVLITGVALGLLPWLNAWDFVILAPIALIVLLTYGRELFTAKNIGVGVFIALMALWLFFLTKSNSRSSTFDLAASSGYLGIFLHLGIGLLGVIPFLFQEKKFRLSMLGALLVILAIVTNHIVFMDRINTVFKFMTTLGTFFLILLLTSWAKLIGRPKIFVNVLVLSSLLSAFFMIASISLQSPFPVKKPSLKGLAFLRYSLPSDSGIINYLNTIPGTPLVLEVPSKSFDYQAARISAYTGMPTWLGWDHHVVLRGKTWQEVSLRKRWVDGMFESPDAIRVHRELIERKVSYIVVGPTERTRYSAAGLDKFKRYPELFEHIMDNYSSSLYQVISK